MKRLAELIKKYGSSFGDVIVTAMGVLIANATVTPLVGGAIVALYSSIVGFAKRVAPDADAVLAVKQAKSHK